MELTKHNPNFRLIETMVYDGEKYVNLVYGISNEGKDEGLEAFYHRKNDYAEHFYRSFRWKIDKIPSKYVGIFKQLKTFLSKTTNGHKLRLSIIELNQNHS